MTKFRQIELTNFKKISMINIDIDEGGNVITVQGANGQGKSSILDGLLAVLGGPRYAPEKPVKEGEKDATIVATLDNGLEIVRQFFAEGGQRLLVRHKGTGAEVSSPQTLLNKYLNGIAFAPHKFILTTPKERVRMLYSFLSETDQAQIQELDGLIEKRQEIKRDLKAAKTTLKDVQLSAVTDTPEDEKVLSPEGWEIRYKEYIRTLSLASSEVDKWVDLRHHLDTLKRDYQTLESKQKERKEREKALIAALTKVREEITTLDSELEKAIIPTLEEETYAVTQYEIAKKGLQKQSSIEAVKNAREHVEKLEWNLSSQKEDIGRLELAITQSLSCLFPEKGDYSFGEDIMVGPIPFGQLSQSEQLYHSVLISMVQNPELRVIRIKDASLFDAASLLSLKNLANKYDIQIWLEVVSEDEAKGINMLVIEDGQVKGGD